MLLFRVVKLHSLLLNYEYNLAPDMLKILQLTCLNFYEGKLQFLIIIQC